MRPSRIALRQHGRTACDTLRYRPRFAALIVLVSALCLSWLIFKLILSVSWRGRWYWNYVVLYHPALAHLLPSGRWGPIDTPPRFMDEVLNAPWMGEWDIPTLSAPSYHRIETSGSSELTSPALLKLHIFSTPTDTAQSKRNVIRSVSPMLNLPHRFRHLVDIKFVLGYPLNHKGDIDRALEEGIELEQSIHGDLSRLEGLKDGENIRKGKILDWMRAVGTRLDGGREALWVFKMDDDTVINLPNFLDELLTLDPRQPVYVGTSLNRFPAYHYHFTGMLTGFSWSLLKTLSAAIGDMSRDEIESWWDDDVLLGELMYSLPSAPQCRDPPNAGSTRCDPYFPPYWGYLAPPPSPDPRTGLIRHDLGRRMGDPGWWWTRGDIARHQAAFKLDEAYLREWRDRIKGCMWDPPEWMEGLAGRA